MHYNVRIKMGSSEQLTNPKAQFKIRLSDWLVVQNNPLLYKYCVKSKIVNQTNKIGKTSRGFNNKTLNS